MLAPAVETGSVRVAAKQPVTIRICLAMACAWLAPAALAADVPALSFEQARERLEQVSDALAAAQAGVRNKQDLQDATHYLRLPEITGDVRRMQFQKTLNLPLGSLAPVAEAFGIESPLEFVERDWRTRPIITATLPLYSGGLIPAAQQAAQAATTMAQAEREAQRQSLSLQLVQAYFGQQLAEQAVQVRREVRDGLERHLQDAQKLEREGFATKAQRLQANVARDKAEREYQKAVNDLATLQQALATLLRSGGTVGTSSPLFVISAPLGTREEFERSALQRHPQVDRMRALAAQAEQGVRVQQAKLKPQLYLFGQYDLRRRDALLTDADWAFGIGLRYTFLSPNARPLQVSAARAQLEQVQSGISEVENQLQLGVGKAWNELDTARAVPPARQQHRPGRGEPAPAGAVLPRRAGHLAGCDRRAAGTGRGAGGARPGRLPVRRGAGPAAGSERATATV